MIVVDTNVILRYLVGSRTPSDDPLCAAAEALFDRVDRGSEQVVT